MLCAECCVCVCAAAACAVASSSASFRGTPYPHVWRLGQRTELSEHSARSTGRISLAQRRCSRRRDAESSVLGLAPPPRVARRLECRAQQSRAHGPAGLLAAQLQSSASVLSAEALFPIISLARAAQLARAAEMPRGDNRVWQHYGASFSDLTTQQQQQQRAEPATVEAIRGMPAAGVPSSMPPRGSGAFVAQVRPAQACSCPDKGCAGWLADLMLRTRFGCP